MINPVIFGSTGMVGKGVLLECLESAQVGKVLAINRQSVGLRHPKLTEVVLKDVSDLSSIRSELVHYNAVFYCLGISSVGMKEEQYKSITYDLTIKVANTFLDVNKHFIFCFVSGASTKTDSRMMWSRVKAKTENDLLAMPFKAAYMFRPGYIQPLKGVKSKTGWVNFLYFFFKPLYFLLKPFKGIVTDTASIGKAMLEVCTKGYDDRILESEDINIAARVS